MISIKKSCSYLILMTIFLFCQSVNGVEHSKVESNIDDSAITAKIKSKLATDSRTSALKVSVETKDGVVTLHGTLNTEEEYYATIEIVYSTVGVTDIDTANLKITSSSKTTLEDATITAKIKGLFLKEKLFGDKPIDLLGIHVETINGIVHLSGKVNDAKKVKTAIQLASSVKGVKEVKSSLIVNE